MQFLTTTRTAVDLHPYKLNAVYNEYDFEVWAINNLTPNSRQQVALRSTMIDEMCTLQ